MNAMNAGSMVASNQSLIPARYKVTSSMSRKSIVSPRVEEADKSVDDLVMGPDDDKSSLDSDGVQENHPNSPKKNKAPASKSLESTPTFVASPNIDSPSRVAQ